MTTTTGEREVTHSNQVDLADAVVERVHIATKPEAVDVWDGCEFPRKHAGDDSLADGKSYRGPQHAEHLVSVKLNMREKMDAYRRNMKPLVAVAMSFVGIAA